jgi:hypothetical protein
LKSERKAAGKHFAVTDLPQEDRFSQLRSEKRHFIDTIKLIAYRAETAMAGLTREHLARHHDARSLMRHLYAKREPEPSAYLQFVTEKGCKAVQVEQGIAGRDPHGESLRLAPQLEARRSFAPRASIWR